MPDTKRLIVNADDFGLHPSVNQAIILGHREGIITSTTVLAGGIAFFNGLEDLQNCPQLGIGAHLCLVDQAPVLAPEKIPSLVEDSGRFVSSYSAFIRRLTLGKIKLAEVRDELTAQIQRLIDAGISITHFDSHQHLHLLPGIYKIVAELGAKFGVPGIRIPGEISLPEATTPSALRRLQGKLVLNLAAHRRREFRRYGFHMPDYFYGFGAGGNLSLTHWLRIIPELAPGVTEVMVHPGADTNELQIFTGWGYHWHEELQALTHPALKLLLASYGVERVHYGNLT